MRTSRCSEIHMSRVTTLPMNFLILLRLRGRYPRISVHSSVFPFRGRGGAGSFLEEEQAAAEAQGVVGSRSSRQMSTR